MDEDEIANLKFDKKALKEVENTSPGETLAIVLLSEAERLDAATFVLDKNGSNDEIICKYKVGENWEEAPRPPASVWSLVYNIYMLWGDLIILNLVFKKVTLNVMK